MKRNRLKIDIRRNIVVEFIEVHVESKNAAYQTNHKRYLQESNYNDTIIN